MFRLQFPAQEISYWADRYYAKGDEHILTNIIPKVKDRGYFTKPDFLDLGEWKSARPRRHLQSNSADYIETVTQIALSTPSERLRIEILTLLRGVSWPVASVILHLAHIDPYPILDYRALWSLEVDFHTVRYDFPFWWSYTEFCCRLADENYVDMRTLDRALWQYSRENQP